MSINWVPTLFEAQGRVYRLMSKRGKVDPEVVMCAWNPSIEETETGK